MKGRMKENIVYEKAYQFAIRIEKASQHFMQWKREFVLSKQLIRNEKSIGANIAGANGGIAKADFSNKTSIAYKECLETKYWLLLLKDTSYIDDKINGSIDSEAEEIAKILFSIQKKQDW